MLIFIFLTPKSWFSGGERAAEHGASKPSCYATLVLSPEVIVNEADKGQIEQRVSALTGRTDVEVLACPKSGRSGWKTRSFEVDIR